MEVFPGTERLVFRNVKAGFLGGSYPQTPEKQVPDGDKEFTHG
jgi:hypothetical protein